MFTDTQRREIFHFCFLQRLLKQSDPALYVLKGGVNLRFFFNSPRYSEDMDLDVTGGSVATLRKNGYKILEDAAFGRSLRTFGIEAIDVNDPGKAKHTATTQRFRLGLVTMAGVRLPTRVEFSRRGDAPHDTPLELIDPDIARQYRKLAFRCRHYPGEVAAVQKIAALAGRPESQARDVFDFYLLYAGGHVPSGIADRNEITMDVRQAAITATLSLSYEDYRGQVLEFVPEPVRQDYADPSLWGSMQETVLRLLDEA